MEYKEFLKETLLSKEYGIYSRILAVYREQMEFLKTPALFRKWLAKELDVPPEAINLSSLNSALHQQRKKNKQARKEQPASVMNAANDSTSKKEGFQFSKPSSDDEKRSRIKEM